MMAAILDDVIDPQQYYNPLYFSRPAVQAFVFWRAIVEFSVWSLFWFRKTSGAGRSEKDGEEARKRKKHDCPQGL